MFCRRTISTHVLRRPIERADLILYLHRTCPVFMSYVSAAAFAPSSMPRPTLTQTCAKADAYPQKQT
jgi:hypothetical protein